MPRIFLPLYSNIDHGNDVRMFKTHVKPQAAGEWFHWRVLNILTSFLWSRRVQTMESYCRFVFYHNIVSFDVYFRWTFSVDRPREKEKNKLCHPYSTLFTFSLIINNCWKAPIIFQIHIGKVHILIFNGSGMCKV